MSILDNFKNYVDLSNNTNKVKTDENPSDTGEGPISDYLPELKLDMQDIELLSLAKQWEHVWTRDYNSNLKLKQRESENYWLGKTGSDEVHDLLRTDSKKRPVTDNLIFKSLETFIPIATREKPDPVVSSGMDNNTEQIKEDMADKVAKMLSYHVDVLKLKLKLKQVVRNWALGYFGVLKVGWDERTDDITITTVKPSDIILDPISTNEACEYTGQYVGQYRRETAKELAARFPHKKNEIKKEAKNKMATVLQYIEWWTEDYTFWTLKDILLDKIKNPHWNYNEDMDKERVDDFGNVTVESIVNKGVNHFRHRQMPYIFLTMYNLGRKPYDETSLIEQTITAQDRVNKRVKQIDKNVDNMNGGWVVSLERAGLNRAQAETLARKLRKGGVAAIPSGLPRESIDKIAGLPLPADVYNDLRDTRAELESVFGTAGLNPQSSMQEKTVGGKVIIRGQDADRIGGGIAEYLEQFVDCLFNWWVQMYYVYYDDNHVASILGSEGSRELVIINKSDLIKEDLVVSVREGSMIPKDPLTRRNEAVDLWGAGAIDPITLFERLEHPNPREAAKKLVMWKSDPISYLGLDQYEMAQMQGQQPQEQMPMGQQMAPGQGQSLEPDINQTNIANNQPQLTQ